MEPAISVLIIPFMILVYIPVLVAHKIGTMMSPLKLVDLNVVVVLSMIRLLTNAYVQLIGHIQMVLLVWHVISHSIGTSLKSLCWRMLKLHILQLDLQTMSEMSSRKHS